jgi:hypothetical protein
MAQVDDEDWWIRGQCFKFACSALGAVKSIAATASVVTVVVIVCVELVVTVK